MVGNRSLISIVIPARNEEGGLDTLEKRLTAVAAGLPYDFEFILIDNHSSDQTGSLAKQLCQRDARWKYLRFSRNFMVDASLAAGYLAARGDAILTLYSDMQDPPELIPKFIEQWQQGFDVVYGVRSTKESESLGRRLGTLLGYRLIMWLSEVSIPPDSGDFRLITRDVRDALLRCGEYNRYTRGLIAWLGFKQVGIPYERQKRKTGKSHSGNPLYLLFFTLNAITSFSRKPLRAFTFFGILMMLYSFASIVVYIGMYFTVNPPRGAATMVILQCLTLAILSLGIGILGEYIGAIYLEVKRRPLFVVQESMNLDTTNLHMPL